MSTPIEKIVARRIALFLAVVAVIGFLAVAGVFAVGHLRDERLPREVAELAADLAGRIGMALDNARLRVPG